MTATHSQGPNITVGYYPGSGGSNPEAGPSATYQADSILDPRWSYSPGLTGPGHIKGWLNSPYPTMVDCVPTAMSNTMVAPALAASTAVSVAAQTLPLQTTTTAGRAVAVPVVPFGSGVSSANAVSCMALDPGHTTGTIASGAKSVTSVGDTRLLFPGMYVGIVGAGGSASTVLVTRILSRTFNTLTVDTAASSTATAQPIIILDPTGASAWPGINAGAVQLFDPISACARAVKVVAGTSDSGYVVTISGYDVYLNPMTESITSVVGTANGKKAFKYIRSATIRQGSGNATITTSLSVGTTDIFGCNLRSEKYEYMNIFFNAGYISASTGWVAALATGTASTATTADTRGTYAVQSASDGSKRLAMFMSVPMQQLISATYDDYTSLHGQAQA